MSASSGDWRGGIIYSNVSFSLGIQLLSIYCIVYYDVVVRYGFEIKHAKIVLARNEQNFIAMRNDAGL